MPIIQPQNPQNQLIEKTEQNVGLKPVLDNAPCRAEYRSRLAKVLQKASHYHGKQAEYEGFLEELSALERWLRSTFGLPDNGTMFPVEMGVEVAKHWQATETRRTIADLLNLASKSYEKFLTHSLEAKPSPLSNLVITEVDGVILPPSNQSPSFNHDQESHEEYEVRFQARIKQLLLLLEANQIYSDDVILIKGQLAENMMRQETYVIIEIPKLNREILVNRQVGEATFVIYGILGRQTLFSKTKETLQNDFGFRVHRIIYWNSDQWEQELISTLLKDVDIDSLQKVNVREQEALRTEILKKVPTPQLWAGMKQKEKLAFQIGSYKLMAISTRFGIQGKPANYHSIHLELGRAIYGEEHECLKHVESAELTPDEFKIKILKQVPTPEAWAAMTKKEKKVFQIGPYKLMAISTRFGVQGSPLGKYCIHLELGRMIYGEKHECLNVLTIDGLKTKILKKVPTPQLWAGMKQKEKLAFQIGPHKLNAIATQFGVQGKGSPISKHAFHLELGRAIYGEEHECLKRLVNSSD